MIPTRRTQPYRREGGQMPGMTLQAMLAGRQPGVLNPADFMRQRLAQANQGGLRDLVKQRMTGRPIASADLRGNFLQPQRPRHPIPREQPGWGQDQAELQQLIAEALSGSAIARRF